ncbi:MAG: radical SAM protein [Actinobacteria bacterium]|nr:radical SAM protein [Actinomycetota bacterium]
MVHGEPRLTLRVARVMSPVTVLGPGRRVVLWVQGCGIGCPGCASVDTWDPDGGTRLDVVALVGQIGDLIGRDGLDGLTITGGEPTDQGEPLHELVTLLRARRPDLDVLVFTGRTHRVAARRAPRLLEATDCVVAGPYRRDLPPNGPLVASANQTVHLRSGAARERYAALLEDSLAPGLQVCVEDGEILLVGLPRAGDLDRFEAGLAAAGVRLEGVTWRP